MTQNKILCCSDTHGLCPPPLEEKDALAWLHAGDVSWSPSVAAGSNALKTRDVAALDWDMSKWLQARSLPVYAVWGNHDSYDPWGFFDKAHNVTDKVIRIADRLLLAGVGWCGLYDFHLPTEEDLRPVCESVLQKLRAQQQTQDRVILLCHYPPQTGLFTVESFMGQNKSYQCVMDLLQAIQPLVLVTGHAHECAGFQAVCNTGARKTRIVFPGKLGGILQVDDNEDGARFEFSTQDTEDLAF